MTKSKQKGAALLTAILITSVVAVLASNIILNQHQWIAQAGLADRQNKFNITADRILDWAHTAATIRSQTKNPSQLPKWPAFQKNMKGIKVGAHLVDGNRLYNLNWLVDPKRDASFARLIQIVKPDIDPKKAYNLAQSVTAMIQMSQGIKPSNQTKAKGPEDSDGVPVVGPLHAALQLKYLKGFTPKLITALMAYTSVLPVKAGINITTGNEKVLKALLKPTQGEDSAWTAYLSCRQAFVSQHPNAAAWQACLQQNDGQDFLKNLGASDPVVINPNNQPSTTTNNSSNNSSDDQSQPQSIIIYRSDYAMLQGMMVQTDLRSSIQAVYWMPNKKIIKAPAQTRDDMIFNQSNISKPKVTLVSYWRS
jgi:type II secretory pathway component PulK